MASAQIDPIFQRDCQHLFNPGRFGIDCKYTGAPPKTKDRAQFKAEQEYNDTEWPHTASIVDLVRYAISTKSTIAGIVFFVIANIVVCFFFVCLYIIDAASFSITVMIF